MSQVHAVVYGCELVCQLSRMPYTREQLEQACRHIVGDTNGLSLGAKVVTALLVGRDAGRSPYNPSMRVVESALRDMERESEYIAAGGAS